MSENLSEMLEYLDMESWLDYEGVDYRITHGSSGEQINIKECPRCGGSSSKVFMNRESGLGNCFHGSCVGEPGFNKFSFIKHYLGSGKAAFNSIERFAAEMGWMKRRIEPTVSKRVADESWIIPESVSLPHEGKNITYLEKRGFDSEIVRYFGWRYCEKGYFFYKSSEDNQRLQDYSQRVIIPIYDLDSNLVTFQGRDTIGNKDKKYLFPPGLPGSARFLYNAHNAVGKEIIIIGEGVMDVAAIKMAMDEEIGLRDIESVGSFGKVLSDGIDGGSQVAQLMELKEKGLKVVVMMWDGEYSALQSACKSALMLQSRGLIAKVAVLPKGKDPNDISTEIVRGAYYKSTLATKTNIARLLLINKRLLT